MNLVAAGTFDMDAGSRGTSVGIAGVQKEEGGGPGFDVHFSVPTQRNGTQRYRWFTQQNGGFGAPRIDWFSPDMSRITFQEQTFARRAFYTPFVGVERVGDVLVSAGVDTRFTRTKALISRDDGQTWAWVPLELSYQNGVIRLKKGAGDALYTAHIRFGGVGTERSMIAKSTDAGQTWVKTVITGSTSISPQDMDVRGNEIAMVGENDALNNGTSWLTYSSNGGDTYVMRALGADFAARAVAFDGARILVAGYSQNPGLTTKVAYSDDQGQTWTFVATPFVVPMRMVVHGSTIVVVGHNGAETMGRAIVSNDSGATWQGADIGGYKFNDVCWSVDRFITVGSDGLGTTPQVATSPDGLDWTITEGLLVSGLIPKFVSSDGTVVTCGGAYAGPDFPGGSTGLVAVSYDNAVSFNDRFAGHWGLVVVKDFPDGQTFTNLVAKASSTAEGVLTASDLHPWETVVAGPVAVEVVNPMEYISGHPYSFDLVLESDIDPSDVVLINKDGLAELTAIWTMPTARILRVTFTDRNGYPTAPDDLWHVAIVRP